MWNFRAFVRIGSSIKRTSRLGTKCVEPIRKTALFHTTGAMAAKIQGTFSVYCIVGGVTCLYRNHSCHCGYSMLLLQVELSWKRKEMK